MSRKKCRRKVWRTDINPVAYAMMGAAVTPDSELDKLRLRELQAVDAFARGAATFADFDAIVAMYNLCEHMARKGVGPEALDACGRASAEIHAVARRMEATGKLGTTGPGLQVFRDLFEFHDLQRQSVSRSEYERAIFKTFERVRNKAPGVVEL